MTCVLKNSSETEAKTLLQMQYMENRNEYQEQLKQIEAQIDELKTILNDKITEVSKKNMIIEELQLQIDKLEADVTDKTKVVKIKKIVITFLIPLNFQAIKILNQRLFDVKKTLQEEIKNNNSGSCGSMPSNAPAILIPMNDNNNSFPTNNISGKIEMDEVKLTYLKHVILKFLTSRELEAKHLIRAVSTLLYLSDSEEKLLYDTIEYRKSWFGTKPSIL
jgi:golgin subfamily A member 1